MGEKSKKEMFNEEDKLMSLHQQLQDILPDQLSLASMHYMRNHAIERVIFHVRSVVCRLLQCNLI